jgi:hypothetical protein
MRASSAALDERESCARLAQGRAGRVYKPFHISTKKEFVQKVKNLTGWVPDKEDRYWSSVPTPAGNGKHYSGVALRWKVIKRVSIPLKVRFPQLGWLKLNSQSSLQEDFDLSERYMEGDKRLRQHIAIERS